MAAFDPSQPLPLVSFGRIMSEELPPIDWLIEPLIAQGDRVVLYGEFGSLKSWLLIDMGLHLAAGLPWLGKFNVPKPRRVLYVDEEMKEDTIRRRIRRLAQGSEISDKALPFDLAPRIGFAFDDRGADNLLAALNKAESNPEVVIVETFRRVLVGSENEAADVAAFWRNVGPILKAGKTLIISHHMRKPKSKRDTANRDRASGSTDIIAGSDSSIAVQRVRNGVVIIDPTKSREGEEAPRFEVCLHEEEKGGPVVMRHEGTTKEQADQSRKGQQAEHLICGYLSDLHDHTAEAADVLTYLESEGISRRTGERALSDMRTMGLLDSPQRGTWTLVTQGSPPTAIT